MNRLTQMTDPLGRITQYVYDERGRQTEVIRYHDRAGKGDKSNF